MRRCWAVSLGAVHFLGTATTTTGFQGKRLVRSMKVIEYEFRITPPDQQEISDWKLKESFSTVVAFKEGEPNGSPKLHYHGYLKATCNIKTIQRWLNDVGESDKHGINGNALFFTRRVHEHTFGYISKQRNCVLRFGTDQTTLDEWYASSTDYMKEVTRAKETKKKRKDRDRAKELDAIYDAVKEELKNAYAPTPDVVIQSVLNRCHTAGIRFPSRMGMETFVIHALYPYRPEYAQSYFNRTFQFIS